MSRLSSPNPGFRHSVASALLAGLITALFSFVDVVAADAACVGGSPNGALEAGEQCDDNNNSDADACLNACTTAYCGDGETRTGFEECDDGNAIDTDACVACQIAECGDGFTQAGVEECDDGNGGYYDACLPTCVNNVCGDGYENSPAEDCDSGGVDAPSCDSDCTDVVCGDAHFNATQEACDDGNTNSNDGCTGTCGAVEDCGDGITQSGIGEECDDANADDTDACVACQDAECGDGFTRTGFEDCDDGDADDTDGCLTTCEVASCGDGFVQTGVEACDDGNTNNADLCTYPGCASATCGDEIVQTELGEQCDQGPSVCAGGFNAGDDCNVHEDCPGMCAGGADAGEACTENLDCRGICGAPNPGFPCTLATELDDCGQAGACNLGGVSCDTIAAYCDSSGNNDEWPGGCGGNCLNASCGDGVIDAGETCDSGEEGTSLVCVISDQGGAPSSTDPLNCRLATCGDGEVCSDDDCSTGPGGDPEECDDGADGDDTNACLDDCAAARCGDGFVQAGEEECDQGDGVNSDTIADRCRLDCTDPSCGDGVPDSGEACDTAGESSTCDADCTAVACGDGELNAAADEQCDEGDLVNGDGCDDDCQIEGCGDGVTNNNGLEECDDGGESSDCDSNCTNADCGDGDLNTTRNEECDDGNAINGDGCDIACQEEYCGDGQVNDNPPEECEPPVGNGAGQCRATCKNPYCGDSITDSVVPYNETCDGGGETSTCDDDCSAVSCGDGNENTAAGEECDDGSNLGGPDTCRPLCIAPACGDSTTDPGHGEQCDSGVVTDCTLSCCSTGATPPSFNSGLAGLDCQLSDLDAQCDASVCKRSKAFERKVKNMNNKLEKAIGLTGDDRLSRAESNVRGVRNRAQSLIDNLNRLCPNDDDPGDEAAVRTCFDDQLQAIVVIALEVEENLTFNNP